MSKALVVFTIIILICIIVFLSGILIFTLKYGKPFEFSFSIGEDYNKILEKEYSIEDFDNLKMNYKLGNIYIKNSDDNSVKVIAYGKEDDEIKCEIEDRNLYIEDFHNQKPGFEFNYKRKIEIYLPKEFSNTIDSEAQAGNVHIESFENVKLNIITRAGNVNIENAKLANIKSDAGNIHVKKVPDVKIETNAGNINIEEVSKKCNIQTDAGNIHISKLYVTENSNIEADMGNINIEETSDIYIETKNDLGKVNVEKNNKNSQIEVYVKTSFGNIHVK